MIISTVKHKGNFLGISHKSVNYVLGFPRLTDAYDVQQSLPKNATIYLKSVDKTNISNKVKASMLEINMPIYNVADDISLDTEAQIVFPKKQGVIDVNEDTEYTIHDMDYYTFMYIPYKNDLGVILPYEKLYEDDTTFVYKANVIDGFWRTNIGVR